MAITSSGIASGIDTKSLVAQLVQAQSQPIQRLQQRQSDIGFKIAKLTDITAKLKALKTKGEELGEISKFLSYKASSGDSDVLSATATGDASAGTFSLVVNNLAKAEKNLSAGFNATSDLVGAGTLSVSINGGTATDVALDADDTLSDAVSKINAANAGVTATIINDGLGTATSHKIQLTAAETGYTTGSASGAVTISDTGTSLAFTESVTAVNAAFTLDGQPITRTSNSFSDLITGVTFNLNGTGTSTLEVASDTDEIKEKAQSFVDAFNDVKNLILKEIKVTKDTNRSRSLASEPYIQSLNRVMNDLVTSAAGTGGTYDTLAQIGITTSSAGTLQLDEGDLEAALASDSTSVANVFAQGTTGISARIDSLVDDFTDSIDGSLITGSTTLSKLQTSLGARAELLKARLESYEARLTRQFTFMEQTIASIQAQGNRFTAIIGQV